MTTPPPPPMGFAPVGSLAKNWMGVTALITGIVGVVGSCCYGLGFLPSVVAIVFGALGKKAVDEGEANNRGMGVAGLILGVCGVVVSIGFWVLLVLGIAFSGSDSGY